MMKKKKPSKNNKKRACREKLRTTRNVDASDHLRLR